MFSRVCRHSHLDILQPPEFGLPFQSQVRAVEKKIALFAEAETILWGRKSGGGRSKTTQWPLRDSFKEPSRNTKIAHKAWLLSNHSNNAQKQILFHQELVRARRCIRTNKDSSAQVTVWRRGSDYLDLWVLERHKYRFWDWTTAGPPLFQEKETRAEQRNRRTHLPLHPEPQVLLKLTN